MVDKTQAEIEFNKSRIIWAVVHGELYWIYTSLNIQEWLENEFNISSEDFELTLRGYIRKYDNDTVDIVSYQGKEFRASKPNESIMRKLEWITSLEFKCNTINWYCGVEKGKPGEIWKPCELYHTTVFDTEQDKIVPFAYVLDYEKMLITILNRGHLDDIIYNSIVHEIASLGRFICMHGHTYESLIGLTTRDHILKRVYNYHDI